MSAQVIPLRKLDTLQIAIRHADEWERYAHRLEALLALVTAQKEATQLLLDIASDEVLRLKGLL